MLTKIQQDIEDFPARFVTVNELHPCHCDVKTKMQSKEWTLQFYFQIKAQIYLYHNQF